MTLAKEAGAEQEWCKHTWETAWSSPTTGYKSPLALQCNGVHVTGTYNDGQVDGTVVEDNSGSSSFAGHWNRTGGNSGGACPSGRFWLRISKAGDVFQGFWTYCEDDPQAVANNGSKRWAWRGVAAGTATGQAGGLPSHGTISNRNAGAGGSIPGAGNPGSEPPQSCAMVGSFCVPDTQPLPDGQPAAHCCNSQGRNPGTAELCIYSQCKQCFRHGEEVPTGGSQVCCEFGEVVKWDQFSEKAVCDIVDKPDPVAPVPPRLPLRLQSRPLQPQVH
jgi:hypothetical protein